jgi:hypothetical protein
MKNTATYTNALAQMKQATKETKYSVSVCKMKLAMTAAKAEVKRLKSNSN